jgi:hypothetical protein
LVGALKLLYSNYLFPDQGKTFQTIQSLDGNLRIEIDPDTLVITPDLKIKEVTVKGKNLLFNLNPSLVVWTMLIIMMVTIASASFPAFIWQIKHIIKFFELRLKHFLQAVILALSIITFLSIYHYTMTGFYKPSDIIDNFGILFKNGNVINTVVISTLLLQIPLLIVIFLVGIAAETITVDLSKKQSLEKAIIKFNMLNQLLTGALQVLAILVVFSVLTTSALQQSIKSALIIKSIDISPPELSYVYGLFFTLFLAIIYIPVQLFLRYRINSLKQDIQIQSQNENEDNQQTYKNMIGQLNVGGTALDNLKLAFTVLAPLISGFLPEQLKIFG